MREKTIYPESITVVNGFLASLAVLLVASGKLELAIRIIFVSLALDVLDGLVARWLKATSEKGEFLDRLFDRIYQVVAPALLYSYIYNWDYSAVFYSSLIITIGFWRLSRRVPSRDYFAGLPMFVHTFIIISSYLGSVMVSPFIMMILAIASLVPVKYYRRSRRFSSKENKGTYWPLRIIIPSVMAILPYGQLDLLFKIALLIILAYAVIGWLPFLFEPGKGLKEKLIHSGMTPIYK